jgi:hypothetical protein
VADDPGTVDGGLRRGTGWGNAVIEAGGGRGRRPEISLHDYEQIAYQSQIR